jgi:hypothetical protein
VRAKQAVLELMRANSALFGSTSFITIFVDENGLEIKMKSV